ncbi:hypothetical protein F-E9_39 [Faustovirus]|nr:hypothetical protein F-E9_39 [Faustovirus]
MEPVLLPEMILEIATRADAATKSRFPCLCWRLYRAFRRAAYRARVDVRRRVRESLDNAHIGRPVTPMRTEYSVLPNMRADGRYIEYWPHQRRYRLADGSVVNRKPPAHMKGRYCNGLKHGLWRTYTYLGGLTLVAMYDYGDPCGVWHASYYNITPPGEYPVNDDAGNRIIYNELVWIDIKARVVITWIRAHGQIVSIKITRGISLATMYERTFPLRVPVYEYAQYRRNIQYMYR